MSARLRRLFDWLHTRTPLPPSPIGPDIRFEFHVIVSQAGQVGIFPTNLQPEELAEIYPQLLPRIVAKMGETVPASMLLETLLARFGIVAKLSMVETK